MTPTGERAVSLSLDRTIRLWDLGGACPCVFCSTGSERTRSTCGPAPRFGDDSTMQIDSTELTVVRWARLSGLPMARGGRLGISSDGTRAIFCRRQHDRYLASGHGRVVSIAIEDFETEELGVEADVAIAGSLLGTLCLIDPEHGRLLRFLDAGRSDARTARILDIVLDAPGRRAITASRDGCVRVWNLTSGQETMTLHGTLDNVDAIAIAPGGRFAYTVVGRYGDCFRLDHPQAGATSVVRSPDHGHCRHARRPVRSSR